MHSIDLVTLRKLSLSLIVSVIQPYEALSIGGVIDFQVDGARHLTPLTLVSWQSAHENKQGFTCIIIFLYLPYSCCYCSLDGVVKP